MPKLLRLTVVMFALVPSLAAQSDSVSLQNSASFRPDGTAVVTRVIPPPSTISPEAQAWLASLGQKKMRPKPSPKGASQPMPGASKAQPRLGGVIR